MHPKLATRLTFAQPVRIAPLISDPVPALVQGVQNPIAYFEVCPIISKPSRHTDRSCTVHGLVRPCPPASCFPPCHLCLAHTLVYSPPLRSPPPRTRLPTPASPRCPCPSSSRPSGHPIVCEQPTSVISRWQRRRAYPRADAWRTRHLQRRIAESWPYSCRWSRQ